MIFNYHRSDIREEIPEYFGDGLLQIPIDITSELIEDIASMAFGRDKENVHDQLSSSYSSKNIVPI